MPGLSHASAKKYLDRYIHQLIYISTVRQKKPAAPESFLPLKPTWFHILVSLTDQEQHGYGIMQEVLERTDGKVRLWPATLYGALKRLIDQNLIEESDERPAPEMDDARRRYYRLTNLGRRVLTAESERLKGLIGMLQSKRRVIDQGAKS
jgi:DNA-binding PadR family transcriptional regulator